MEEKTCGVSHGVERSSMGVQVIKFLENNLPSFSQHREKVGMKRMNGCKKKPIELLSIPKVTWRVCFLQSQVTWKRVKTTRKKTKVKKKRNNGCKKILVEFLSTPKEAPHVCFL